MNLGDRMKSIEGRPLSSNLVPHECVYARLDGKGFSKFTKGFDRPFDDNFRGIMVDVARCLMEKTGADVSYIQSDEISLFWNANNGHLKNFNGRMTKWIGELSGVATATIMLEVMNRFPEKAKMLPRFDCRVFNLSYEDAVDMFLWRVLDCYKNAVNQVAYTYIPHKLLSGKNRSERINALHDLKIDYFDYSVEERNGTFLVKKKGMYPIDKTNIPDTVKDTVPDIVERSVITKESMEFHGVERHDRDKIFKLLEG